MTKGCHRKWAKLRKCDFLCIGITQNHSKAVLESVLEQGVLVKRRGFSRFKVSCKWVNKTNEKSKRGSLLSKIVGKNLRKMYSQNRNTKVPKKVTINLPNEESVYSQIGNITYDSYRKLPSYRESKDKVVKNTGLKKREKDSKKPKSVSFKHWELNPYIYKTRSPQESVARNTWERLGSDRPHDFDFFIKAARLGLPPEKFYEYAEEAEKHVSNKLEVFRGLVSDYFQTHDVK
jgi:hypothetical protein